MKVTKYYKVYKVRLFPTLEQEILFNKYIGACRFVYNYMLDLHEKVYNKDNINLSGYDMARILPKLRKENPWLNELSLHSLSTICLDLNNAYKKYFKKVCRHPKFKSKKKSKETFPVRTGFQKFYFRDDWVKLEKIGKIKVRKFDDMYKLYNEKCCNARVVRENKKWILKFSVICESQALELTDKSVGIDLGIKELAVCSFGGEQIVFHNINKSKRVRKLESKAKHIHRKLSRKYSKCKRDENGKLIKSSNILREEERFREIYYRLSNIRNNHIHQITHKIIMLRPKQVIMEDLKIEQLRKNKSIAREISNCKLYEFITIMKHKCIKNEIPFIQVPRFYPSSKTCSNCGHVKNNLKLSDRTYICPECGLVIDRDFNAARNLENYVLKQQ